MEVLVFIRVQLWDNHFFLASILLMMNESVRSAQTCSVFSDSLPHSQRNEFSGVSGSCGSWPLK